MDKGALVSFISFVELDHEIVRLTEEKNTLLRESEQIEANLQNITRQKEQIDTQLHDLKKNIDHANLDLKALDANKKEKKEKLEEIQNPREYQSLEQELINIRKQQESIEEVIINYWSEHEKAQVVAQAVAQEAEKTNKLLLESREKNKIALEHLSTRIEKGLEDRKKLELVVSPELLLSYNTMKERVSNPAVPVIRDSCTGCFYAVNPSDLQNLKKNGLVTCKDCYRMLYLSPVNQESPTS